MEGEEIRKDGIQNNRSENILNELLKGAVIPTVLVALGYFLGWSSNAAYFVRVGVPTSFLPNTIPGILVFAWVDIILAAITLVMGVGIYLILDLLSKKEVRDPSRLKKKERLFFLLLIPAISLGLASIYMTRSLGFTLNIIIYSGISVFLFWIASILGKQVLDSYKGDERSNNVSVFRLIYPTFYIYLFITILATVFILNRFGIWRGTTLAERDLQWIFNRPNIVLYSENPLPLEGSYDKSTNLYTYSGLHLFAVNDQYIFVLKKSDQNSTSSPSSLNYSTYFIQRDKVQVFEMSR
jgi:hypothetical protein